MPLGLAHGTSGSYRAILSAGIDSVVAAVAVSALYSSGPPIMRSSVVVVFQLRMVMFL